MLIPLSLRFLIGEIGILATYFIAENKGDVFCEVLIIVPEIQAPNVPLYEVKFTSQELPSTVRAGLAGKLHRRSGLCAPQPTASPLPLLPLSPTARSLPIATCALRSHATPPRPRNTFTDVTTFLESRTAAAAAHGHQPLTIGATVHARGAAGLPL